MVKAKKIIGWVLFISAISLLIILSFNNKLDGVFHIYDIDKGEVDSMILVGGLNFNSSTNLSLIEDCVNQSKHIFGEPAYSKAICECVGEDCLNYIEFEIHKSNITVEFLEANCKGISQEVISCKKFSKNKRNLIREGKCFIEYNCQEKYFVEIK